MSPIHLRHPVYWRTYLRLAKASDRRCSHTQQCILASINSWNKIIPFSCWQQWSEKAIHVGHVNEVVPAELEAAEVVEVEDVEPDESGEQPLLWFPFPLALLPLEGGGGVVTRKICINNVCCIKANWSAPLRMLEVTITSRSAWCWPLGPPPPPPLPPPPWLPFPLPPPRHPTGILSLKWKSFFVKINN